MLFVLNKTQILIYFDALKGHALKITSIYKDDILAPICVYRHIGPWPLEADIGTKLHY